ncbi:MAG: YihY/virulence factor BrkB family protein [Bacteroidales bacterium]|nr:YihY/virulence factor BrkB family protein [Bacteroidales bacterium]
MALWEKIKAPNNLKVIRRIIFWSKKIVLPGFDGMPLYDVTIFFFKGITKGYITERAASIAYNFFLALFPMIIVFFTLIPFIPINGFHNTLMSLIQQITPEGTFGEVNETLADIINRPRGGLLSFTFVLALYFATNGFQSVIDAFNRSYHAIESRSWIKRRLISILLFLIITIILILAISLIISGSFVLKYLLAENILGGVLTYWLLEILRWVIIIAIFFFSISFIYYLAPAKESQFRFISAGSTLATLLSLAASIGFNYYVQNFSSYNALYGSIGTLLIVLIWIYFNALILLIGFELNTSIQQARHENIFPQQGVKKS